MLAAERKAPAGMSAVQQQVTPVVVLPLAVIHVGPEVIGEPAAIQLLALPLAHAFLPLPLIHIASVIVVQAPALHRGLQCSMRPVLPGTGCRLQALKPSYGLSALWGMAAERHRQQACM